MSTVGNKLVSEVVVTLSGVFNTGTAQTKMNAIIMFNYKLPV